MRGVLSDGECGIGCALRPCEPLGIVSRDRVSLPLPQRSVAVNSCQPVVPGNNGFIVNRTDASEETGRYQEDYQNSEVFLHDVDGSSK